MSSEFTSQGASQVRLPPIADLTYAGDLKALLIEALNTGQSLEIDASEVQSITSPCLQILVAAVKTFSQAPGLAVNFSNPSAAFVQAAATLALGDALGLQGV
jgi:anti-anti-sigma regulatory factor